MSQAWVASLKVAELKEELRKRGQPVGGVKAVLADRLLSAISAEKKASEEGEAPASTPPAAAPQREEAPADQPPQEPQQADADDEKATAATDAPQEQAAPVVPPADAHDAPMSVHALLDDEDAAEEPALEEPRNAEAAAAKEESAAEAAAPATKALAPPPAEDGTNDATAREPLIDGAEQLDADVHGTGKHKPITFAPPERKRSLPADEDNAAAAEADAAEPPTKKPKPAADAEGTIAASTKDDAAGDGGPAEPASEAAGGDARTNILYIDGLMRPFTEGALRQLLTQNGTVTDLWMPSLKTHAVVTFETTDQAEAARAATHMLKWPTGTLKQLMPRFVTADEAAAAKAGKGTTKPSMHGDAPPARGVLAALKASTETAAADTKGAATAVGTPRGMEGAGAREDAANGGGPTAPAAGNDEEPMLRLEDLFRKTVAKPCVYYLPLTDEQVAEKKAKAAAAAKARDTSPERKRSNNDGKRSRSRSKRR